MPTRQTRLPRRLPDSFPQMMKLPNEILCQIIRICFECRGSGKDSTYGTWRQLCSTSKRWRILAIPLIFHRVEISDNHDDRTDFLHSKLLLLEKNELILRTVRYFVFRANRRDGVYHYETPPALLRCLAAMPNLREFSLRLAGPGNNTMPPALASHLEFNSQVTQSLYGIVSLSIHSSAIDQLLVLVMLCPNLENMYLDVPCCIRHCAALCTASRVPRLRYIMLARIVPRPREQALPRGWTVEDVRDLATVLPKIRHLALVGMIENTKLSDFASEFSGFEQLEQLDMTDEQVVSSDMVEDILFDAHTTVLYDDLDYDDDPDMMEYGIAMHEAEDHWLNEDRKTVATKFFESVPSLQRLCFSRCSKGVLFEAVRDEADRLTEVRIVDFMNKSKHTATNDQRENWAFGYPRVLKANQLSFT